MKLFRRKQKAEKVEVEGLDKVKKKDRKKSLRLLEEYKRGLVIKIDKDIDQKSFIAEIRKGN
jgi:hypothetical protein